MHLYRFAQMLGGEKLHGWSPEGCNLAKMEISIQLMTYINMLGTGAFQYPKVLSPSPLSPMSVARTMKSPPEKDH